MFKLIDKGSIVAYQTDKQKPIYVGVVADILSTGRVVVSRVVFKKAGDRWQLMDRKKLRRGIRVDPMYLLLLEELGPSRSWFEYDEFREAGMKDTRNSDEWGTQ